MSAPEYLSVLISIASFTLSIFVAYFSYFRASKIEMLIGRNIILFPSKVKTTNGDILGLTFNIPVTFFNWSPQGGTIYRMRLLIGQQQNNEYYDMTWTTFVKIGAGGNFEDESLAQSIAMAGRSSNNKLIRFDWNPEFTGEKLDIRSGKYNLMLLGWTANTEKPDLRYTTSFFIGDEQYKKYSNIISSGNFDVAIWLSLDDDERPNTVVTKTRVEKFYLSGK